LLKKNAKEEEKAVIAEDAIPLIHAMKEVLKTQSHSQPNH
jgi:hypothetical protein